MQASIQHKDGTMNTRTPDFTLTIYIGLLLYLNSRYYSELLSTKVNTDRPAKVQVKM